jgi:hypothetical protein
MGVVDSTPYELELALALAVALAAESMIQVGTLSFSLVDRFRKC